MPRELGDERARYGRRSLREQLDDAIAWPGKNRFAAGVMLVVIAGALLLVIARGRPANLADLRVGDCLFVPTAAAQDEARPIGQATAVEDVILAGGAQQAGCTASHGHEVAAIVGPPSPTATLAPSVLRVRFDRDAIRRVAQLLCEAAFAGYVGHALAGSRFMTFPVAPDAADWIAGGQQTTCLVARVDGQWMGHPARGSAE